jgi:gamma-glutamyltranspeptidase/glutathione hydrolase
MRNNFAISAGHEETLRIAELILRDGGNAFDACIAAVFAMFITEPCMASAGAAGFAACYSPNKGVKNLDFFTQTPRNRQALEKPHFNPIKVNFGGEIEEFYIGMASIATPGLIAGLYDIHERFASLPMDVLISASDDLVQEGVTINTFQALDIGLLEPVFRSDKSIYPSFFKEDRILQEGDHLKLDRLNDFFTFLKKEGSRGFYEGEISRIIDEDSISRGGFIRRDDLENYKTNWLDTNWMSAYGMKMAIMPYPSMGGLILSLILHFRDELNHTWTEAIRIVKTNYSSPESILNFFKLNKEQDGISPISTKGTSHINVFDDQGNACAITTTLGEGSGYFIPGTDMQMNNMLGEIYLFPGGKHSWTPNSRMMSMMCPVLAFDDINRNLTFMAGSGGAGRIPYALAQVMEQVFLLGRKLDDAIKAPRIMMHDQKFHLEPSYVIEEKLKSDHLVHWEGLNLFFGGVHAIYCDENRLEATGDLRRFGVGKIF